ncbi:MAG: hypothetical protein ACHREM_31035 [Polyangiales bacterium]
MDPLTIALLAGGAGGIWWMRKKHPEKLPKFLQPKGMQAGGAASAKAAAVQGVVNTSAPTPHPTAGLDPNMSTSDVASANQMLATATDANAVYAMASSYSEKNFVKTSQALIAKADALSHAKAAGASDAELLHSMMTAGPTANQVAEQARQAGATVSVNPDTGTIHSEYTTPGSPAGESLAQQAGVTEGTSSFFGNIAS